MVVKQLITQQHSNVFLNPIRQLSIMHYYIQRLAAIITTSHTADETILVL